MAMSQKEIKAAQKLALEAMKKGKQLSSNIGSRTYALGKDIVKVTKARGTGLHNKFRIASAKAALGRVVGKVSTKAAPLGSVMEAAKKVKMTRSDVIKAKKRGQGRKF